jgi:transposase
VASPDRGLARRGRSLLTPEVETKLLEASRQGMPVEAAAAYAGIGKSTFMDWMARGRTEFTRRQEGKTDPAEEPYVQLLERIDLARETAHAQAVLQLRRLINGGFVTKEVTKKLRDPETGEIYHETTVDRASPDFRAISWYLERAHRGQWGKDATQIEITGAAGGPVQVERVDLDDLATRLQGTLHALEYPPEEPIPDAEIVNDPAPELP